MTPLPIVITQNDVAGLEERVRVAMAATGYNKEFTVKITLDDDADFVDVHVTSEGVTESIGLKFETPDGRLMIKVDTDGDGQ